MKKRYCPDDTPCCKGFACHDLCVELDNPEVGLKPPTKPEGSAVSNKNYGIIMLVLTLAVFGLSSNFAWFFGAGDSQKVVNIFAGGMFTGAILISIFHWAKGRKL